MSTVDPTNPALFTADDLVTQIVAEINALKVFLQGKVSSDSAAPHHLALPPYAPNRLLGWNSAQYALQNFTPASMAGGLVVVSEIIEDFIYSNSLQEARSAIGAADKALYDKLLSSFYHHGAVGDGVADDTTAVLAAISAHLSSGIPLHCGNGTFKVTSQVLVDVSALLATTGTSIHGAGRRRTILKSTYTDGVPFLITGSGGAFYHTIKDIGFEGVNDNGPVLQIGKNDYSDTFNACEFTGINVNNNSTSASCEGARLNFVDHCDIDIVSNCGGSGNPAYPSAPGAGSAIVLRQVQFSRLRLGGGNANIGLKITGGYTFGNVFPSVDLEEVQRGVRIESANVNRNIFQGGTIVASYCISATAGASNVFQGTVLSAYAGGSLIDGTNNVGVTLQHPGYSLAVNQLQFPDALPGGSARAVAYGPDSHIRVDVVAKGNGDIAFTSTDGRTHFLIQGNIANSVNYMMLVDAATSGRPGFQANGADSTVGMRFSNKGTALTEFTGQTVSTSATAGTASALPGAPDRYWNVIIDGVLQKIPLFRA